MEKKKSLGQHFLQSQHYLDLIADTAQIQPDEYVLEIGPGDGALTKALLARGAYVVAIEKDHRLISVLTETFAKEIADKTFTLIEGDALEFDTSRTDILRGGYKLVANIPYYITGAILKKFLSEKHPPSMCVLLVQKEVATRIARDTKESILSLSVKVYGEPMYVKTVPAGAFSPPPKVDSAILAVKHISHANIPTKQQEEKFFELVRTGFGQKRKLLKRNLEPVLGANAAALLVQAGIADNARAEDVPLQQWLVLANL